MKTATLDDEYWMAMALILAGEGEGLTRPNPPVGAVVVKNGRVVGLGFHPKAGQPHAEVVALRDAGPQSRGATLYVTLEPCSTHGRTPPCTDAIVNAGITRVVFGCIDPNPAHAGRSERILRKAGISVKRDVLREACSDLIQPFAYRITKGRPLITLKLACSLDGRIGDRAGVSKWITGIKARNEVQALRRTADAILVGAETVRLDNPSLIPKPHEGRKPLRIVIAGRNSLPAKAKLFTDASAGRTLVFATKDHTVLRQRRSLEKHGARVITVPGRNGNVKLPSVMKELAAQGCMHIVCEGGGVLAASLLREELVDRLWMFYAPIVLGGDARPGFSAPGWRLLNAPRFRVKYIEQMDDDLLVVSEATDRHSITVADH